MSSVIASARGSAVSLFNAATKTANMAGDAVDIAATGLDMLAVKTRHTHRLVTHQSQNRLHADLLHVEKETAVLSLERDADLVRRLSALGVEKTEFEDRMSEIRNYSSDDKVTRIAAE